MAFDPELYCLLHTGTPGDTTFYGRLCAGKTVLELGCGDGRISQAMVEAGAHVWALEIHQGMVDKAEKRRASSKEEARARWVIRKGDMSGFALAERFELVVIPYSGIFCLAPLERQRCFRLAAEHLEAGGMLVMDAYATEGIFDDLETPTQEWTPLTILETSSGLVLVNEREAYEPEQRVRVDYRFELIHEGGNTHLTTDTIVHHCFEAAEVAPWLQALGFDPVRVCGDFELGVYHDDAEHMVVMATLGEG